MKLAGIIIGAVGTILFVWHLVTVLTHTEDPSGDLTHHWLSLVGGVLMFAGIWIWIAGHRKQSR